MATAARIRVEEELSYSPSCRRATASIAEDRSFFETSSKPLWESRRTNFPVFSCGGRMVLIFWSAGYASTANIRSKRSSLHALFR